MLISSYEHSVDVKGRIFVPAKWREDLGDTVAVIRGLLGNSDARCLFGMSESALEAFIDRVRSLAISDVVAQNTIRLILSEACICDVDKQGRILISPSLREFARIGDNARLMGTGTRIELWAPGEWTKFTSTTSMPTDEMLNYLAEKGI